jgi:hypothetical protein
MLWCVVRSFVPRRFGLCHRKLSNIHHHPSPSRLLKQRLEGTTQSQSCTAIPPSMSLLSLLSTVHGLSTPNLRHVFCYQAAFHHEAVVQLIERLNAFHF